MIIWVEQRKSKIGKLNYNYIYCSAVHFLFFHQLHLLIPIATVTRRMGEWEWLDEAGEKIEIENEQLNSLTYRFRFLLFQSHNNHSGWDLYRVVSNYAIQVWSKMIIWVEQVWSQMITNDYMRKIAKRRNWLAQPFIFYFFTSLIYSFLPPLTDYAIQV